MHLDDPGLLYCQFYGSDAAVSRVSCYRHAANIELTSCTRGSGQHRRTLPTNCALRFEASDNVVYGMVTITSSSIRQPFDCL